MIGLLRGLIALLALALPATLWAEEAEQASSEPVVITGIVKEFDLGFEPGTISDKYERYASFAAWRLGDGPVETTLLWLTLSVDTEEQAEALKQQFREKALVRFLAKGKPSFRGDGGAAQSAEVDWLATLDPVADDEVSAAADLIFNPQAFDDPELGTFEPHPSAFGYFGQLREWLGEETIFEVILEPMGPNAREQALSMARLAWAERAAIDAQIREQVTDHIYSNRTAEAGLVLAPVDGSVAPEEEEDSGPSLSREDFNSDHKLVSVSCSAQQYCVFGYSAQQASWEWSYNATIMLSDDGWYVDGWDFP